MARLPERPPARGTQLGRDLLARVRLAARDDDVRSGGREAPGDGEAETARAAGDERHAAREVE
jgi:hypothetical protein